MTALWALVVVVNKKILESVTPLAVNFLIRLVAIAGLLLLTVPLTVFGLWSNGFGIDAESAGWIALSAVATWLVAFNAYYYALRGARVAVVAPICSTDPIWTAFFAWLLLGSAFGAPTLVGMAVAMTGVALISRRMDEGGAVDGELAGAGALAAAAHGDVLPDGPGAARHRRRGPGRRRRRRPGSSGSPCSPRPAGAWVPSSSTRPRPPTAAPPRA